MLNSEHQKALVSSVDPTTPKQGVSALPDHIATPEVPATPKKRAFVSDFAATPEVPATPEKKEFVPNLAATPEVPATPEKKEFVPNLAATPEVPATPEESFSPFVYIKKRKIINQSVDQSIDQSSNAAEELLKKAKALYDGYKESLKIYETLANAGNAEAMTMLGVFYLSGDGVKPDYNIARSYFRKSAHLEHPEGMYRYANCLFINQDNCFESQNECLVKAVSLYYKSALKNYLPSIYKYGYCMLYGLGVGKNLDEAFKYILQAANLNYTEAVLELANCYYNGWGVKQDINKALSLYQKAGELGCSDAYIALGRFCDGTGKITEAIQNFMKALDEGNENGRIMLQMMKDARGLSNVDMEMRATTSLQTSFATTAGSSVISGSPALKSKDINKVSQSGASYSTTR